MSVLLITINEMREELEPGEAGQISDGYHTFDELYAHREALTAALFRAAATGLIWGLGQAWKSRAHHPADTPCYDGYFIVGLELPAGTITYHYPNEQWDDFREVMELAHAPKWDGAPPAATVERLLAYARSH